MKTPIQFKKIFISQRAIGMFNISFALIQLSILGMYILDPTTIDLGRGLQMFGASCFIGYHLSNLVREIPNPLNWWVFFSGKKIWMSELVDIGFGEKPERYLEIMQWLEDSNVKHYVGKDITVPGFNSECVSFLRTEDLVLFKLTWYDGEEANAVT